MHWSVFLLLYGIAVAYSYPVYMDDHNEGVYEIHERIPRSLDNYMKRSPKNALSVARDFIRTFLPSAAQIGFQGIKQMVKRGNVGNAPLSNSLVATTTPVAANVNPATTSYYYNYQTQGYPTSNFYSGYTYPYYSSYQYPYYASAYSPQYDVAKRTYTPQYDVAKRTYTPYTYNTNSYFAAQPAASTTQQSAYQYHYPAVFAAYNAAKQSTATVDPPAITKHAPVPDTSTANGISQGLIDLENDVKGFNQAIQYMKEAFIAENKDGSSDLQEHIHEDKSDVVGEKKDQIKKEKTSAELMEAFKRTLESKERLENKLVSYFTNYVCGDDC